MCDGLPMLFDQRPGREPLQLGHVYVGATHPDHPAHEHCPVALHAPRAAPLTVGEAIHLANELYALAAADPGAERFTLSGLCYFAAAVVMVLAAAGAIAVASGLVLG